MERFRPSHGTASAFWRPTAASALFHAGFVLLLWFWTSGHKKIAGTYDPVLLVSVEGPASSSAAPHPPSRATHRDKTPGIRKAPVNEEKVEGEETNENSAKAEAGNGVPPSGDVVSRYASEIVALLDRKKVYPRQAILQEQEGKVVLEVMIESDGRVAGTRILEKSPFNSLNDAAVATIRNIPSFPPPPGAASIHVTIPLVFRIERH